MTFVDSRGARLEVLDWGGAGPAVVLIPGLGSTAHIYDELAPRLRGRLRVIAVTRRGFGASSRPATGYDTRTLANDVLRAMDESGIRRAVLVGHSFGGAEVTWLATHVPERIAGVVLLESYCYGCAPPKSLPPTPSVRAVAPPPPSAIDRASREAFGRFLSRRAGAVIPEAEVEATTPVSSHGEVTADTAAERAKAAVRQRIAPLEFMQLTIPEVLVLGLPTSARDLIPWEARPSAGDLARSRAWLPFTVWSKREWARRFVRSTGGRVVFVPHAPHHVFLSDPDTVAATIESVARHAPPASP